MCTDETRGMKSGSASDGGSGNCSMENGVISEQAYCQLKPTCQDKRVKPASRVFEKLVYVSTVFTVIFLSHAVVSHQWILPWFYACATPILVLFKTVCYWRNKWQFFMIDFCYTANTIILVYTWLPGNENLFRVAFALANGPVLMAAMVFKNSLVFHHHDKVSSTYIHILPALITFCARWSPAETSALWYRPFLLTTPAFDPVWLYAVPFGCFFLHSCFYCLIVNVIVRPKENYVTSYNYLAAKYAKLVFIKGPIGRAVLYYGFNWLFCLVSLLAALLAYWSFIGHVIILAAVFTVVVYNGAGYYMHVFNKLGHGTES